MRDGGNSDRPYFSHPDAVVKHHKGEKNVTVARAGFPAVRGPAWSEQR